MSDRAEGASTLMPPVDVARQSAGCRLLYLVGELHTGGLERQLWYLLRAMDRDRYKPAVAVWNYREEDVHVGPIRALGVPIHALPAGAGRVAKLGALSRLARRLKPEVIHSYTFYTNFAAYWAARSAGAVGVGSVRGELNWGIRDAGPVIGRLSARWPAHQVCNAACAATALRELRGPFLPRQLSIVRNGLDLDAYPAAPLPARAIPRILGVGYLLPVKRWDLLLGAARQLKQAGIRFEMRIAGGGPLRSALEQQARDLGVNDCVEFLGDRSDVARLLADSTVVVHTSDSEGCPNAVMEAMASGRAVVATDAGDIPLLIENGVSGFVVPRGDTDAIAERLSALIGDPGLCARMGEAARAAAVRAFGLQRLVTESLAAYRSAGWRPAAGDAPGIADRADAGVNGATT